jgi:hypothetical protein
MKTKPTLTALQGFNLDIDMTPQLCHPQVGMFIDPEVEISDVHIQCLYEAIQYANRLMHGED